jgi:hypothetical protein
MGQAVNEYDSALPGWLPGQDKASSPGTLKLGSLKKNPEFLLNLEKVKAWTRERFTLSEEATILVSEISCTIPGCPPLETVVAFWTEDKKLHHFKLFKPLDEVVYDDLPLAWLMDSLADDDGFECC